MKIHFFSDQTTLKLKSLKELPEWLSTYPVFKDQIKLIRETLGMSQEKLGKLVHRSLNTIQNIESGRAKPKISTLEKLAEVLNAELKIYLIPRRDLAEFLDEKAEQKARQIVGLDKASSSLEVQTPSEEAIKEQIKSMKREILEKRRSSLWE
jgi:transcriptional regulator with XRE-family HTH domain